MATHGFKEQKDLDDLLSGNIAVLSQFRALLLRKKGRIEIGTSRLCHADGLQKKSS